MKTIRATELKNRLGAALAEAALEPIAIEKHGRIVAMLTPPPPDSVVEARRHPAAVRWDREMEDRVIKLCASGDFRPSRWSRAGDPRTLAGIAMLLASNRNFDRRRMLRLAERLWPGMSTAGELGRWLEQTPVQAARIMPMIEARMRASHLVESG